MKDRGAVWRNAALPEKPGVYLVRYEGRAEPLRLRYNPGRGFFFPRTGGDVVGKVVSWEEAE